MIDFPTRGIEPEEYVPKQRGDSDRKYFASPMSDRAPDDDVFFVVKNRQMQMAVFSVFASPE